MLHIKSKHRLSERCYDDLCQFMKELLSGDNVMIDSFYETKKLVKGSLALTPRLQRLYASEATAESMRWHDDHFVEDGEMRHCYDSSTWKHFNAMHPSFAAKIRKVRLGLCTNGFQPFEQTGSHYSLWPVILTPYNLPLEI